jgi:Protein of unknown function (DUF3429)
MDNQTRTFDIHEHPETPPLSVLFAWGPMIPFVVGALATWVMPPAAIPAQLTVVWGGAIMAFLSGVRRGLSFRTPGGPRWQQIATMIWLFLLAIGALVTSSKPALAIPFLIAGFTSIAVLDPIAARRSEAPLFFARLRPVQMLVPVVCLCAIAAKMWGIV